PILAALRRCGMVDDSAGTDLVWRSAAGRAFTGLAACSGGIAGVAQCERTRFDSRGVRCGPAVVLKHRDEIPDACLAVGCVGNHVECGSTYWTVPGFSAIRVEPSSSGAEV